MVEYKCFRCGYIGKQKTHLMNHLKRKKPCLPLVNGISIKDVKKYMDLNNELTGLQQVTTVFGSENGSVNNRLQQFLQLGTQQAKTCCKISDF